MITQNAICTINIVQFQLIETHAFETQSKAKQNFHMTRKDTEIEFMDVDETTS